MTRSKVSAPIGRDGRTAEGQVETGLLIAFGKKQNYRTNCCTSQAFHTISQEAGEFSQEAGEFSH